MVGRSFDDNIELQRLLDGGIDNRMPLLLFPGDDAVTLDDDNISDVHQKLAKHFTEDAITSTHSSIQSNSSIKSNNKYLLIIVDGTWKQAKQILRNSPSILRRCQPVQFKSTSQISIYDSIRKQPDSHCLSTLESCERTLTLLEPRSRNMKLASYHLLSALKAMILKQMKYEQRYLENHPELVRNVVKLHAKKIRQEQLMLMDNIIPPNNTHEENNNTEDTVTINISSSVQLPKGYELRQLKAQTNDAKYVDSIWPYSSKKSLGMIEKQIHADNVNSTRYNNNDDGTSSSACCLGIEYKKELVACIIRHRNGSLGILHVEPQHRYLGLAQVLLQTAMDTIASRDEKLFAYILDGNKASERLFSKLGWRKDDPLGKRGTGKRKAKRLWIHPGSRS